MWNRGASIVLGVAVTGIVLGACSEQNDDAGYGSCNVLIACAASLAPEVRDEYRQAYGQGGSCWKPGVDSWPGCRAACVQTLSTLNALAEPAETCGTCSTDLDCIKFGGNAYCDGGLCAGGLSDAVQGEEASGDGDGDGDDMTESCDGYQHLQRCIFTKDCCGYATEEERLCRTFPSGYGVCTVSCDTVDDCPLPPPGAGGDYDCYAKGCVLTCSSHDDCVENTKCWSGFCH
jgi:hypothetical protein